MTPDIERVIWENRLKLETTIWMIRMLIAHVNRMDGNSGAIAESLNAFLTDLVPKLDLPDDLKTTLTEPIRQTLRDFEPGAPPPTFTVIQGGRNE